MVLSLPNGVTSEDNNRGKMSVSLTPSQQCIDESSSPFQTWDSSDYNQMSKLVMEWGGWCKSPLPTFFVISSKPVGKIKESTY